MDTNSTNSEEEKILYKDLSYKVVGLQCEFIQNLVLVFLKKFMRML
jgi:hypothetical protein